MRRGAGQGKEKKVVTGETKEVDENEEKAKCEDCSSK
jgi:hypothetical protein